MWKKRRGDDESRNTTPSEKKGLKSYKGDRRALSIANTRLLRSDLAFFSGPRYLIALLLRCCCCCHLERRQKKRKRAARKWSASCFTYIPRLIFFACILHCPGEQGWVFFVCLCETDSEPPEKSREERRYKIPLAEIQSMFKDAKTTGIEVWKLILIFASLALPILTIKTRNVNVSLSFLQFFSFSLSLCLLRENFEPHSTISFIKWHASGRVQVRLQHFRVSKSLFSFFSFFFSALLLSLCHRVLLWSSLWFHHRSPLYTLCCRCTNWAEMWLRMNR